MDYDGNAGLRAMPPTFNRCLLTLLCGLMALAKHSMIVASTQQPTLRGWSWGLRGAVGWRKAKLLRVLPDWVGGLARVAIRPRNHSGRPSSIQRPSSSPTCPARDLPAMAPLTGVERSRLKGALVVPSTIAQLPPLRHVFPLQRRRESNGRYP